MQINETTKNDKLPQERSGLDGQPNLTKVLVFEKHYNYNY
jgi:hypothetical protein